MLKMNDLIYVTALYEFNDIKFNDNRRKNDFDMYNLSDIENSTQLICYRDIDPCWRCHSSFPVPDCPERHQYKTNVIWPRYTYQSPLSEIDFIGTYSFFDILENKYKYFMKQYISYICNIKNVLKISDLYKHTFNNSILFNRAKLIDINIDDFKLNDIKILENNTLTVVYIPYNTIEINEHFKKWSEIKSKEIDLDFYSKLELISNFLHESNVYHFENSIKEEYLIMDNFIDNSYKNIKQCINILNKHKLSSDEFNKKYSLYLNFNIHLKREIDLSFILKKLLENKWTCHKKITDYDGFNWYDLPHLFGSKRNTKLKCLSEYGNLNNIILSKKISYDLYDIQIRVDETSVSILLNLNTKKKALKKKIKKIIKFN